jgi:hypothetical protein
MPNLNKDQIQQIVLAARTKRSAGANEATDVEYSRMLAILRYYTQQAQARVSQQQVI